MKSKIIYKITVEIEKEEEERIEFININGHQIPKGLTKLNKDDIYYLPDILNSTSLTRCMAKQWRKEKNDNGLFSYAWQEDYWLKNGLCHRTSEHASMHAIALLSFQSKQGDK